MLIRTRRDRGLLASLLLLAAGCGSDTAHVAGDVTYEGQPVENGTISFAPADGKGPSAGAVIDKGRYTVAKVPPGSKVVRIEAYPAQRPPGSSEEAKGAKGGKPVRLIPLNAEGNNAKVDLKAGDQKLDFHLKKPSK